MRRKGCTVGSSLPVPVLMASPRLRWCVKTWFGGAGHGGGSRARGRGEIWCPYQVPRRTLMRTLVVKRQTLPQTGFFPFFSAVFQAERRPSLATCSVFIAVSWCPNVAPPNTYGGSLAAVTTRAETTQGGLCDRETSLYPRTVLCKEAAERVPFARECQARGRGSPRQPDTTIAVGPRAGADGQSQGRAQGERPLGSWACATPGDTQDRARYPGASRERPVRRWAHPLRS